MLQSGLRPVSGRSGHGCIAAAIVVAVVAAVISSPSLAAQQTSGVLDGIVREALRQNLGLAQERLAYERAEAGVGEARGRLLPTLALEGAYRTGRHPLNLGDFVNPAYAALNDLVGTPLFPTDLDLPFPMPYESRLRVIQPLFDPAGLAGHSAARHARDAQREALRVAARRVAAEAQVAYLRVAEARTARQVWEAALEVVREGERVAQLQVDAGHATPEAVYRARAERMDVEQQLAEAAELEAAATRGFNLLLGRRVDAPVEVLPDSALRFELRMTADEAVAAALGRREELAQVESGVRAAGAAVRLARSASLPHVAIALEYGFRGREVTFDSDEDYRIAALVVSWSPFSGGRTRAQLQGARADLRRLELGREELERRIRVEVLDAYQAAANAHAATEVAEARVEAARRGFELARRRYEEGLAPLFEFLDARAALTSAELNRVRTMYRYAARYIDLERAAALRELPIE